MLDEAVQQGRRQAAPRHAGRVYMFRMYALMPRMLPLCGAML
jgi:hypothetical protein